MWAEFTYDAYGLPQIHVPGAPDNTFAQAVQASIGLMLTPERKNTLVKTILHNFSQFILQIVIYLCTL